MFYATSFLALGFLVGNVLSRPSPIRSKLAVKDSINVPPRWTPLGPASPQQMIPLQIGLKQGRFDELEKNLYEVSDPSHARYGQHLTADQVNQLIQPSDDTLAHVQDWLADNGIANDQLSYSPAKDWIDVNLPVPIVEKVLNGRYLFYKHEDGSKLVRTTEWSIPIHLHDHITTIQPTNTFLRAAPRSSFAKPAKAIEERELEPVLAQGQSFEGSVSAACNVSLVTPRCLRTLYGTLNYTPRAAGKNKVGLTDYLGESNNRSDVTIFLQRYRKEAVSAAKDFTFQVIDNGSDQQTPNNASQLAAGTDLEGNLDAETIIGQTYPTPLIAYTTGGSPPFKSDDLEPTNNNEPYLPWLRHLLAQPDSALPKVISTSYADDEQTVPITYANTVCSGLAQLGARGISVLFGSGDGGVGETGNCFTNDGKHTRTFLPKFPASCPYVTTIGATRNFNPEVAAFDTFASGSVFTSGGGFSNYFPRPSYQDTVVSKYVASLGNKYAGLYNKSGRGYPDIAAQGQRYATIWNGSLAILDGTSAATPTAASVISLLNDALIAAGKSPLGFLNPWIYSKGFRGFTDVLSGSSAGCNTTGFAAAKGWDAVTGFGTPNFPALMELVGVGYGS